MSPADLDALEALIATEGLAACRDLMPPEMAAWLAAESAAGIRLEAAQWRPLDDEDTLDWTAVLDLSKRTAGTGSGHEIGATLEDVGQLYAVSRERIRQIQASALRHVGHVLKRRPDLAEHMRELIRDCDAAAPSVLESDLAGGGDPLSRKGPSTLRAKAMADRAAGIAPKETAAQVRARLTAIDAAHRERRKIRLQLDALERI